MTQEMFQSIISAAQCVTGEDGSSSLPAGSTITLYAGHEGVAMQAGKVVSLRLNAGIIEAKNSKGELFVLALEDVFAASIAGGDEKSSRKAGFLG